MRRLIIFIAIALAAAACGGGASSSTFASLDAAGSDTLAPGSETTIAPGTDEAVPPVPAELPESDYPDVRVVDLAGGELNLRELALEAEPVLLWFWAPH